MVTEKCQLVKQPVNVRGDNESVRRKTWIERVFPLEDTYIIFQAYSVSSREIALDKSDSSLVDDSTARASKFSSPCVGGIQSRERSVDRSGTILTRLERFFIYEKRQIDVSLVVASEFLSLTSASCWLKPTIDVSRVVRFIVFKFSRL